MRRPSLTDNPVAHPLSYPGWTADRPGLFLDDRLLPIQPRLGTPYGEWTTEDGTLDEFLRRLGHPVIARRRTVLAVGSNASPGQLYRKFKGNAVIPMVKVRVRGVRPGVSAHVSRHGYLPAAPVFAPEVSSDLWALLLDDRQLAVLDASEPNYDRVETPDGDLYVGKHGVLADRRGRPRELVSQAELISGLLADIPELAGVCGANPSEWVRRTRDPEIRKQARNLFRKYDLVVHQRFRDKK